MDDVAQNKNGQKAFMLAQSYMPAQDIHIVKNFGDATLSPWNEITESDEIITLQWIFTKQSLRKW